MHSDEPEPADDDVSTPLDPDVTTMADKLRADGRIVATDGGAVVSEQGDDAEACDRCGGTLGTPGDDAGEGLSYCSAYDAVCADCLLDHGPDDCAHDGPTDARTCSECGETFESFLDCARHERPECPETRDEGPRPEPDAEPTRSEPADFGGGESAGVEEL